MCKRQGSYYQHFYFRESSTSKYNWFDLLTWTYAQHGQNISLPGISIWKLVESQKATYCDCMQYISYLPGTNKARALIVSLRKKAAIVIKKENLFAFLHCAEHFQITLANKKLFNVEFGSLNKYLNLWVPGVVLNS
mgnify:CR=1 FL=1